MHVFDNYLKIFAFILIIKEKNYLVPTGFMFFQEVSNKLSSAFAKKGVFTQIPTS